MDSHPCTERSQAHFDAIRVHPGLVEEARARIQSRVKATPCISSAFVDSDVGKKVLFKCENFQRIGAFKFRGACNSILTLPPSATAVVTHSSGNHAQAVALAARMSGLKAHIVMPSNSAKVKIDAVRGYGAELYFCEPVVSARADKAEEVLRGIPDAHFIHAYDNPLVMAGQGTCALELLEQAAEAGVAKLDVVICPVGGGGLASGVALALQTVPENERPRLVLVEPKGADDAFQSLAKGVLVPQTGPDTVADGLRTSLGKHTWPVIRDSAERIITVSEADIVRAMRDIYERMKIVVEPSSATVLAAMRSEEFRSLEGVATVGAILTGGNVDFAELSGLFAKFEASTSPAAGQQAP